MESSENEKKEECKKSCCGSSCCCAKLFLAFLLLLIGGIMGYLVGKSSMNGCKYWKGIECYSASKSCPVTGTTAPTEKAK